MPCHEIREFYRSISGRRIDHAVKVVPLDVRRFDDRQVPVVAAHGPLDEVATVGYATVAFDNRKDDYYWICEDCFRDFDRFFHWEVIEGDEAEKF